MALNVLGCFSWNDRVAFFIFEKTSASYSCWITIVCLPVIIWRKTMFHEKKHLVQLSSETQSAFLQDNLILQCAEVLYVFFPFCDTLILNRCIPKGWFNKINNFTSSSKTFLNETGFFSPREYFGSWRTQWQQIQSGASALIYTKAPRFYPAVAFAPSVQASAQSEGQMMCQCYYENRFHLANPLKKSPGCGPHFENHWSAVLGTWQPSDPVL